MVTCKTSTGQKKYLGVLACCAIVGLSGCFTGLEGEQTSANTETGTDDGAATVDRGTSHPPESSEGSGDANPDSTSTGGQVTDGQVTDGQDTEDQDTEDPGNGEPSVLSELAKTVKPGTFVELEIDGSVSTCQALIQPVPPTDPETGEKIPQPNYFGNILEFTDEASWDPEGRDVYITGTRRPYARWDQGFVKYSEATNSWTILELPPFGIGAHGYDNGAISIDHRQYYWSRIGAAQEVWTMDLDTNTWRQLPNAPIQAGQFSAIEFFPEIDRLVFFDGLDASEYALYNPSSDQWDSSVALDDAPFGGISHFSEYNPTFGTLFFGGGYNYSAGGTIPDPTPDVNESRRFYMLDSELAVTRLADPPTPLGQSGTGPVQTIDPNSGNLIVFQGAAAEGETMCSDPLPIWEYDYDNNTWEQTGVQQLADIWCRMNTVAVPIYEYGINFIVSVRSETDCRVHLYRHSAGPADG